MFFDRFYKKMLLGTILLCLSFSVQALEVPPHNGKFVVDNGNFLSRSAEMTLNSELAALNQKDGTQILVLTIDSLERDSLEDFSMRVAEAWGAGEATNDNGVLLLVSKKDRIMRIEVGYGLEGVLTDLLSGRIIDYEIAPYFKQNQYEQGIINGTAKIIDAVNGIYTKETSQPKKSSPFRNLAPIFSIIFFFFIFSLLARGRGPKNKDGGGRGDGGDASWIIPLFLFSGRGSRGGGSSGGFGGFGGFSGGGGGFGGGGASGSW